MKTNWYQKLTWSGHYLYFHLHQSYKYKINAINNLLVRGITIAHKDFHGENIEKIEFILLKSIIPRGY